MKFCKYSPNLQQTNSGIHRQKNKHKLRSDKSNRFESLAVHFLHCPAHNVTCWLTSQQQVCDYTGRGGARTIVLQALNYQFIVSLQYYQHIAALLSTDATMISGPRPSSLKRRHDCSQMCCISLCSTEKTSLRGVIECVVACQKKLNTLNTLYFPSLCSLVSPLSSVRKVGS